MRKLTIKRTKSFVACLAKLKVYVEDHRASDLIINDVPCRKLGDLKNGEEVTFEVEEQAVKIFVIADQLSKNYCNEFYQLPEGQEDVYLTGKNQLNPASGNPFRFDNNDNPEAVANRKRGSRTGIIVMIVAIVVGIIVGYLVSSRLF